ncbi:hypothetical protein KIN20_021326 [Parelaphostrongylus tenuis]|uniref:Uncharacterized protein n=1 Tax=Parelaphostrongylus tenuis TaxID=148309 RepID=A0AAD5MU00_PARTN|nr:hypothetical protein KIN20_021326 [Parelaphostrongylus tenuis]
MKDNTAPEFDNTWTFCKFPLCAFNTVNCPTGSIAEHPPVIGLDDSSSTTVWCPALFIFIAEVCLFH